MTFQDKVKKLNKEDVLLPAKKEKSEKNIISEKTPIKKRDSFLPLPRRGQGQPSPLGRKMSSKKVKVGDTCILKISAIGPKGVGIDEYSYSYSIFVPNGFLGQTLQAKIIKINLKDSNYAVAQITGTITKNFLPNNLPVTHNLPVTPDQIVSVNISSVNSKGTGIVVLNNDYKLIIPNANSSENNINVLVTRVKLKYAFAKVIIAETEKLSNDIVNRELNKKKIGLSSSFPFKSEFYKKKMGKLLPGSKYNLILPKVGSYYGKYAIVRLQQSVVFIKLSLGAKPGNKVKIKITKINEKFGTAKIIQVNPKLLSQKKILIQNNIREMIKNGMHLGEKAVKCNARMKNFIWIRKQGTQKNRPMIKKDSHVINLLKTRRCLNKALSQLSKYAVKGRTFLFIGTKKPAAGLISRAAIFSKTSFFVNTRWLGGMLTNWKTILKSISKIRPILKEKQKIIADILEKRQAIKIRLIKKALLLKKKSKLILNKGRFLVEQFKNETFQNKIKTVAKNFAEKKTQLIDICYSLLSKRKGILLKRREVMYESILLKEKGLEMIAKYKNLLNQLLIYTKKLRELKYLLILSNNIKTIKLEGKEINKEIIEISYSKIKELVNSNNATSSATNYNLIPNPPKDLLNLMLTTIKNKYDNEVTNTSTKSTVLNKKGTALVFSKLVNKFSRFEPYLKELINKYQDNLTQIQSALTLLKTNLNKIKLTLISYSELKSTLVKELNSIKTKLMAERFTIRFVLTKLNQLAAHKKLIKFLPRLRYLATPLFTNKITQTVKILMKKIVDPKLKYPVENIYEDKLANNSKKILAERKKKWQRLEKYFGGIANMTKMTKSQISKNIAIVIGQKEEMNAVKECQKLGIKMFNIVDTNCNPSLADHIIPSNDDSRNSIKYILNKFLIRIRLAQKLRKKVTQKILKKVPQSKYTPFLSKGFGTNKFSSVRNPKNLKTM